MTHAAIPRTLSAARRLLMAALAVVALVVVMIAVPAAQQKPEVALKAAIDKEVVDGDLKAAIGMYRTLAAGADRAVAAQALVRMGQCYEKLGASELSEARKAYEQVVAKFGDQSAPAAQAKARLAAMGAPTGRAAASAAPQGPLTRLLWGKTNWWSAEIAPDGKAVAFIDMATANLWVRDIATGADRRLTEIPEERIWSDFPLRVRWSPDGRRLAFDWFTQEGKTGTSEIRVVELATGSIRTFPASKAAEANTPHDWSPDGSRLLVTLGRSTLGWLSLSDGAVTPLEGGERAGLQFARMSPDGAWIAYGAGSAGGGGDRDMFVTTTDGTSTRPMVVGPGNDGPVGWTPDGAGILYVGERSGVQGLWLAAVAGGRVVGTPQLIAETRASFAGLSRTGKLLSFSGAGQLDICRATVDLSAGRVLRADALATLSGARPTKMGSVSPDGRYVAYLATTGNRFHVIVAEADGANPRSFATDFSPSFWAPPAWSADSAALYLDGRVNGSRRGVFRLDLASRSTTELVAPVPATSPGGDAIMFVGASADGKVVYVEKNLSTRHASISRRDVSTGVETELYRSSAPAGIFPGGLSPDGTQFAILLNPFDDAGPRQILALPVGGGAAQVVHSTAHLGSVMSMAWTPDGRSLIYAESLNDGGESKVELWQVALDGTPPRKLGISHQLLSGLAVHPDGQHLFYAGGNRANMEVWLMENFLPPSKK